MNEGPAITARPGGLDSREDCSCAPGTQACAATATAAAAPTGTTETPLIHRVAPRVDAMAVPEPGNLARVGLAGVPWLGASIPSFLVALVVYAVLARVAGTRAAGGARPA